MADLGALKVTRKSGTERFVDGCRDLGFDLLSFWQWSTSDLVSNATRGIVAEYIVGRALGVGVDGAREEWAAFDLITPSGIKVEVKSAAFVQSWHQNRFSTITFRTPKTRALDEATNSYSGEARRQADVYVFAVLAHKDKATINPLDVGQWEFYVLPTAVLDARTRSQHSIALGTLRGLCRSPVRYAQLGEAVAEAAVKKRDLDSQEGRAPDPPLTLFP